MENSMTAIDNTPLNKNFLSPLNFQFQLKRAPHVNFFIQRIRMPSIAIADIEIPTMFNYIQAAGNKLKYGELDISFKIDEDFRNYLEIHNWIRALGFPESFDEYNAISKNNNVSGEGIVSDISLIVLNSAKRPNFEVTFRDAFPVSLSDVDFDTTDEDVKYVTASTSFKYTLYDIKKII